MFLFGTPHINLWFLMLMDACAVPDILKRPFVLFLQELRVVHTLTGRELTSAEITAAMQGPGRVMFS
jgi:hypothetical protein